MNILHDKKKFTIVNLKDVILLNFAVNQEKKHTEKVLQKLVESKKYRKLLKPVSSRSSVMYGSCKVHKTSVENYPPF